LVDNSLSQEPTAAMIDNHYRRLHEIWQGAYHQWDEYDSYYFRTYNVWEGPVSNKRPGWLKPATPAAIVNNAVDRQLALQPVYHRFPTSDRPEAREAADRVEKALQVMAIEQAMLEPTLTWKTVGKNLSHLGYAVLETGLDTTVLQKRAADPVRDSDMDDDEWKAAQRLHAHYRRTAMPFRARVPHPARILMDPWEKKPRLAIRHFRRFAQDIEDMVRARKALGKKTEDFSVRNNHPFEMYSVDEWWTEHYHAMMLSGIYNGKGSSGYYTYNSNQRKLLFVERNMWGFVPYSHAFSGFGQEPTMESQIDPKHLAVGILDPVMSALKAQAQQMSSRHNAVIDASWLPIVTQDLSADELRDQLDEGDFVEGRPDSIQRMQPPNHPRWMFQHGTELDEDIQRGTLSRQLAGEKTPGVNTVGQQAILIESAGRKFVGISWQMEYLAATNGSHQLQLIDLLDLDLTVRGKRIRSADLDSDYSISATFNAIDPVVQFQNRQTGLAEVQAGVKSLETFWAEDAMLEDASGERRRLLQDFLRRNPLIHQELALEVAREEGIEELYERAIERAKQEGAQTGPQRGTNGTADLNQALTGDVLRPDTAGANRAGGISG
jgi:hypothetical protein